MQYREENAEEDGLMKGHKRQNVILSAKAAEKLSAATRNEGENIAGGKTAKGVEAVTINSTCAAWPVGVIGIGVAKMGKYSQSG